MSIRNRAWAGALLCAGLCASAAAAQPGPPVPPGHVSVSGVTFDPRTVGSPQDRNATDQPGNISGVWMHEIGRPPAGAPRAPGPPELLTMEGERPPLQPWAAAIYAKRREEEAAGMPFAGTMGACLPHGMPAMMILQGYPIQIIQSPGQVTTLHELMHSHRIIYIDEKLPPRPDPSYMGTSVGHWEGDTLVVTTIGIREETTLGGGIPHSDQLRTVERLRRLDPTTLEMIMTIEDPKAYTKPWRVRVTSRLLPPSLRPIEYICDNQRNSVDAQGRSGADVKK